MEKMKKIMNKPFAGNDFKRVTPSLVERLEQILILLKAKLQKAE